MWDINSTWNVRDQVLGLGVYCLLLVCDAVVEL